MYIPSTYSFQISNFLHKSLKFQFTKSTSWTASAPTSMSSSSMRGESRGRMLTDEIELSRANLIIRRHLVVTSCLSNIQMITQMTCSWHSTQQRLILIPSSQLTAIMNLDSLIKAGNQLMNNTTGKDATNYQLNLHKISFLRNLRQDLVQIEAQFRLKSLFSRVKKVNPTDEMIAYYPGEY